MASSLMLKGGIRDKAAKQHRIRNVMAIPKSDSTALESGLARLDATFLYADLANSSKMAVELDVTITARLLKVFLWAVSRTIKMHKGEVTSFDGDRVMGVFHGKEKNRNAVKCALKINFIVQEYIYPIFHGRFKSIDNSGITIDHAVGVDTGKVVGTRAGIRGSNDLIWIGRAPNLAAKLSDLREGDYKTFISEDVYNDLTYEESYSSGRQNMWERRKLDFAGKSEIVYRSHFVWKF